MADVIQDLFGGSSDDDDAPRNVAPPLAAPAAKPAAAKAAKPPPAAQAAAPRAEAAGGAGGESDGGEDDDEERGRGRSAPRPPRPVGPPLELEAPLLPPPPPGVTPTMIRMSNILNVESRPFDPDTHALESESYIDEAGNRQVRLLDLNVLRWRYGRNALGEETVESNARFIRWSDGSLQLQVGSEVLDVAAQDVSREQSQLFVRHPGAGILQAQAPLQSKLVLRPSSLQSKSHKLLSSAMDKRYQKVIKVKKVVTSVDPDAEKAEREKAEDRHAKDRDMLQRKREGTERRYGLDARRGGGLTGDFLEGDDEGDDGEAPAQWTGAADARAALASGRRERGGGSAAKPKRKRAAALVDSDEDGSGEESWSEEERPKRAKGRKRVADEDSD